MDDSEQRRPEDVLTGPHAILRGARETVQETIRAVTARMAGRMAGTTFAFSLGAVAILSALLMNTNPAPYYVLRLDPGDRPAVGKPFAQAVLMEWVSAELDQRGLSGFVSVSATLESLTATGTLPESHNQGWIAFQRAYDQQRGAPPLVANIVFEKDLPEIPPVAMVRLSEPREILFADGTSARLGAAMPNGWRIDAIDAEGMVVVRADRRLRIVFATQTGERSPR